MKDFSDWSSSEASPQAFAATPASWYYIGSLTAISAHPLRFDLPDGHSYVAFRGTGGTLSVLHARCSHMLADLSRGCVRNGHLTCPLHGWEYGADGICRRIPALSEIPPFARQKSFPVEERGGHVFFFNRSQALFPLPFFGGMRAGELLAARPFEFTVEAPWYLVSANGFDVQHFRCAHDRTLIGEPIVDSPHPFAWRFRATFHVAGESLLDRFTRAYSGSQVQMTIENWAGNLVLVTAQFRRTRTYGLVSFVPLDSDRTRVRDIVWVPRRRNRIARRLLDPLDAMIRRYLIREFVRSDATRSAGIRYHRSRMIVADKVLVDYFEWLQNLPRGVPAENP